MLGNHKKLFTTMIGVATLPVAVLILAGCAAGTTGAAKPSASAGGLSAKAYEVAYDKCLNAHGAGPTHSVDAEGHYVTTSDSTTYDPTSPANIACTKKLGPAPVVTFKQTADQKAKALATAKCLRANGIDVPDPTADGISQMPVGSSPEINAKCGLSDNIVTDGSSSGSSVTVTKQ